MQSSCMHFTCISSPVVPTQKPVQLNCVHPDFWPIWPVDARVSIVAVRSDRTVHRAPRASKTVKTAAKRKP